MSDAKPISAPPASWFEMIDVRRRSPASAVWIVLKQSETLSGMDGDSSVGAASEYSGIDSIAVPLAQRADAADLQWTDLGGHGTQPYAFKDGRYKAADQFLGRDDQVVGISLVLREQLNSPHTPEWLLHQDLALALRLLREGDVWLAVDEGYVDAVRLQRNDEGRPVRISIRAEFLRDYLAARGMVLRGTQYFQRWAIVQDASTYPRAREGRQQKVDGQRFELRTFPVGKDGSLTGSMAVFQMWRTDVADQGEVPEFGPETENNTAGTSAQYDAPEAPYTRVEGELWRDYWVEPGPRSERVRNDASPEDIFYFTGAAGERTAGKDLNNEDVGRYLWFRSSVVPTLLRHRGAGLEWYTRETGGVSAGPGQNVHFGLNPLGLLTVYAFDVARLPAWEQRIWAGHNVAPDGGVSEELLDAQMRVRPARTRAPERSFVELFGHINGVFDHRFGAPLFKPHAATKEILANIHRFRAHDQASMLALAKDIARLTADSIDAGMLRTVVKPPKEENWRSLRHLEKVLAHLCGDDVRARSALTALAGIYELRLADAHLPSRALIEALPLVPIDPSGPPLDQAVQLLDGAVHSLKSILAIAARPSEG
jgi:hypothetical protein